MSAAAFRRFAFAYGTAFAFLYVVALASFGVVLLGTHHSKDIVDPTIGFVAPAIYWYGWTATAAIGALIFGFGGAFLSERWTQRAWLGWLWVVPTAAMTACVYLTLPWFRL
jgi:hypothetical protein